MNKIETALCDEIYDTRECGEVYCGVLDSGAITLTELATQFGLISDSDIYREIDQEKAIKVAIRILQMDLAYDAKIMTEDEAQSLTARFFAIFEHDQPRCYTNGNYYEKGSSHGWTPATSATFDTGILILGTTQAGCLWVSDED